MHASSLENMRKCHDRFMAPAGYASRAWVSILDVGGADINGNYRDVFSLPNYHYLTADIADTGVDIRLHDPYLIPLPDDSQDIVISGQAFEHCEYFWLTFQEMVRVMKKDGFLFLIAPSAGPIHRYPVDCYRFYPDAYAGLARLANCRLEAVWLDERGPWRDLVGVFRKSPLLHPPAEPPPPQVSGTTDWNPEAHASAVEEGTAGDEDYLVTLERIHRLLAPRRYLEIGVRHGRSLALAHCPALGIDPVPALTGTLAETTRVLVMTSDDFFDFEADKALWWDLDLAFIDGMHHFECVLRDFMHLERRTPPTTLIVVDDIFPNHAHQAARDRRTRVWTGDVWKLYWCLKEQRPDLALLPLNTSPTGMLLIAGLDSENTLLWDHYNPLVRRYLEETPSSPPEGIIARDFARKPSESLVERLITCLRVAREETPSKTQFLSALRELMEPALG